MTGEVLYLIASPEKMKALAQMEYGIKDSGKRIDMGAGMTRDTEDGKIDYTLILDGPMFDRWAEHLTKGAKKYAARNWMQIQKGTRKEIEAAMERAKRSFLRHSRQWLRGDTDEDHAAAAMFNMNMVEYCKGLLEKAIEPPQFRYFRCPLNGSIWRMPINGRPGHIVHSSERRVKTSTFTLSEFRGREAEVTEAEWKAAGGD